MQHLAQAFEISRQDLLGNIAMREWRGPEGLKRREILLAGRTKFTELWARDAAFAIPALLALGRPEVVRNTLEAFFDLQHDDGRFPRRLSGMSNVERNARVGLRRWFGVHISVRRQIRPEFLTGGPRFVPGVIWYRGRPKDVNSLILTALAAFHATGHDRGFATVRRDAIERALEAVHCHTVGGLVRQHHFEDWEDHTKHSGHGLYTNVLYHTALRDVAAMSGLWRDEERAALLEQAAEVRAGLARFWLDDDGYFTNFVPVGGAATPQPFSVPGNMLAILAGIATPEQRTRIADKLESVVDEYGYVPIAAPGYSLWMTPMLRVLFVRHYLTGRLMLPWLQLLAARAVATERPQFARRLVAQVAEPLVRYGRSVEALFDGHTPLRYFFTAPEEHFTWGSAALHDTWTVLAELDADAEPVKP